MTSPSMQQCTQCQTTLKPAAKCCHHCGKPVAATQPKQAVPQLVRVREQSQGAYSILMPKGWQYSASIQLYPDGNAVSVWQTHDSSGLVTLSCPGTVFSFQEPMMMFLGHMLPNRRPLAYMPARTCIQRVLLPQLQATYPHMRVEHIVEHPELIPYIRQQYSKTGQNPAQAQFGIASIQFTYTKHGQNYRQVMYMTTLRLPAVQLWDACITSQLCAHLDTFANFTDLLATIAQSFQWNQQWMQQRQAQNQMLAGQIMQGAQAKMQQAQMQALQMQRQNIMDIGNIARAGQARRMAAQEQQFHTMDNIIAGNIDLRGPDGQVYNVTNDYQPRHWIDGLGQIHGGNWNTRPGLNWTPLEPTED